MDPVKNTYPLCGSSQNSSVNVYLDPNVPTEHYNDCPYSYIGDGICGMSRIEFISCDFIYDVHLIVFVV